MRALQNEVFMGSTFDQLLVICLVFFAFFAVTLVIGMLLLAIQHATETDDS